MQRPPTARGNAAADDDDDRRARGALAAHALAQGPAAHDRALLAGLPAGARFVLLGEASHGTHEFYARRAALTQALIAAGRCDAVVVEGDWPDAWRVNRFVRGLGDDAGAAAALSGFQRFPGWMWRNTVVAAFVDWLRAHNAHGDARDAQRRSPAAVPVGFYGMDLYSLFASLRGVVDYLERADPAAAARARERYACFDHFHADAQEYGQATAFGMHPDCEAAVLAQLREMLRRTGDASATAAARGDDADAAFHAAQNARLVANAEAYYRSMFRGRVLSWNLRDRHMVETVEALDNHLRARLGRPPTIAVWAHNSHLGDARATEMGEAGEWNVGQLMRERFGAAQCHLVGFSTYGGSVTAAAGWDQPGRAQPVNPGLAGSWEALLHGACDARAVGELLLPLRDAPALAAALATPRLQRAIGVVYAPRTERQSHYFAARLPQQFDALLHIDRTRALQPLAPDAGWDGHGDTPETFPAAL